MSSKQLESILKNIPSATVTKTEVVSQAEIYIEKQKPDQLSLDRIAVRVPIELKDEIKSFQKNHPGETETTIILKALKKFGFNVKAEWLIDRRKLR